MDAPDRVLEKLDEMQKKREISQAAINAVKSIIEYQQRAKELVSNYDYMNWLESFIKEHNGSFRHDEWLYKPDEISKEDLENVNKLSEFFEGIQMYANDNYYYPIPCDYGSYYLIEYNDKIYEISCLNGQGTVFWVYVLTEDTKVLNVQKCIKFKDICENNPNPWKERINSNLNNLEKVILGMVSDNVPVEAIVDNINTVIEAIEKNKKAD